MNSIFNALPDSLSIKSQEYSINTDYRAWIRAYTILLQNSTDEQKAIDFCSWLQDMHLPLTDEAMTAAVDFLLCGNDTQTGGGGDTTPPCFDFEADSEYIFAAFWSAYGIDLSVITIHWWKFIALFQSLPDDCQLCKIMRYRAINLDTVPDEQKKFYGDMKNRYALPHDKTKKAKTAEEHEKDMKSRAQRLYEQAKNKMSSM
ncbi:MAG: Gp15 family bacteriophage protein [Butyricicoccus pullicaecorum]|nr:Gp15 family bacteriophage protein [Butyricicoccus pullicaecorum]